MGFSMIPEAILFAEFIIAIVIIAKAGQKW